MSCVFSKSAGVSQIPYPIFNKTLVAILHYTSTHSLETFTGRFTHKLLLINRVTQMITILVDKCLERQFKLPMVTIG